MSSSSRPSLQRVQTRKTVEKQQSMMDVGVTLSFDEESYTVRAGDLSALDTRELRKQVGYSFNGLLQAFATDPDIDLVAGIVWLAKRIAGDKVTPYEEVAAGIDYSVFDSLDVVDPNAEQVDGDPEESAGPS